MNGAASGADEQLKIAFVTGNKMKVSLRGVETSTETIIDSQNCIFHQAREVEMILSEDGTTNLTHPEESLVSLRIIDVDLPEIQEVNPVHVATVGLGRQ